MACACRVNQEIERIHRYYSNNGKREAVKEKTGINKKDAALTLAIYIMLLPLIPIMFLSVILFSIFSKDGKISIRGILNFIHRTRNGKKQ
jgi:hypothetical protein